MGKIEFKYRIDELLNRLSVTQYKTAMQIIPEQLNISTRTFFNYRNIRLNDTRDIPHKKVATMEKLFGLAPGELQNFVITASPIFKLSDINLNNALR